MKITDGYPFYQRMNYRCKDDGTGSFKCDVSGREDKLGKLNNFKSFVEKLGNSDKPVEMSYEVFKAKSGLTLPGDDHGMLRMPHGISKADARRRDKLSARVV